MNTIVGKSAGIALLLAAGLMLALFAMGVFSTGVGADEPPTDTFYPGSSLAIPTFKATNSDTAGAAVRLTIKFQAAEDIDQDQEIKITLPDFGLPSTIDRSRVSIRVEGGGTGAGANQGTDGATYEGNPADDVSTSGDVATLIMGRLSSTADIKEITKLAADDIVTIVIQSSAGVTNPEVAKGDEEHFHITVDKDKDQITDDDATGQEFTLGHQRYHNYAPVIRKVSVKAGAVERGTDIVISGTGFANGSAVVYTETSSGGQDDVLGTPIVDKGAFTLTLKNDVKDNENNNVFTEGADGTKINASDSTGNTATTAATHIIKPSLSFSPTSVSPGETLTITLNDVPTAMRTVSNVQFAGNSVIQATSTVAAVKDTVDEAIDQGDDDDADENSSSDTSIQVQVPSGLRLGAIEVRVSFLATGQTDVTKNITIVAKELTVSPSTAVPGQEITIQGSGFGSRANISSVKIDSQDAFAGGQTAVADSGGNISITVRVPHSLKDGARKVEVKDSAGRVGEATLTVPKAAITLSPSEGLRGSEITVTGSGFPANDQILLKYDNYNRTPKQEQIITSAPSDSTGNFEMTIKVPVYARLGNTQKLTAESQINETPVTANADHTTPNPEITLSPTSAYVGQMITISGMNYAGLATISEIKIGDIDKSPVPAPVTNLTGSFTASQIVVPPLELGSYTVRVTVGEEITTAFLDITDPPPPPADQAPADVFESLGESLVIVWRYDKVSDAEGTWLSYSPSVPAEVNNLNLVSSGDILWVEVTETQTIEGITPSTLYAGWNQVILD